jgi:hypothetical protein
MYYIELRRDGSLIPPDAFDNHEFPHARRNPFCEFPGDWADTCMWAVMRGATYLPMTLQPESLESWQVELLKETLAFARKNADSIYTGKSRMVGGNPNRGEIYGFEHPNAKKKQTMLALRNPAPSVQEHAIDTGYPHQVQIYPDFRRIAPGEKVPFGPHQVRVICGTEKTWELPSETPFITEKGAVYMPNSERPGVKEIYCLPEFVTMKNEFRKAEKGAEIEMALRIPYRMRNSRLTLKLKNCGESVPQIELRYSRYGGWHRYSSCSLPVTEIPFGSAGNGERKNPGMDHERNIRFYTFDVPQGGEAFLNLEINGCQVDEKDIELNYSGFMAPAREAETGKWRCPQLKNTPPPAYPEGFYLCKKLL